jgi:hypothetical protein
MPISVQLPSEQLIEYSGLISWLTAVEAELPKGSKIRVEMAEPCGLGPIEGNNEYVVAINSDWLPYGRLQGYSGYQQIVMQHVFVGLNVPETSIPDLMDLGSKLLFRYSEITSLSILNLDPTELNPLKKILEDREDDLYRQEIDYSDKFHFDELNELFSN